MAQEISPGTVERDVADSAANYSYSRRKELFAKAVLSLGILAAAVTASAARPNKADATPAGAASTRATHPLEFVGVTSNRIWVPDINEARLAAQRIAAMGANTVRIFEPYSPGQAEISYDRPRLCNAAEAARENNLTLEISFIGVHRDRAAEGGGRSNTPPMKHNYVPDNASAVYKYLTAANTILQNLAGPNSNKDVPGLPACVQEPLDKVIFEPFNEVNSSGFNSNNDPAQKYAYLMARAGVALRRDADNITQTRQEADPSAAPFELVIAAGGLAVGHHDAVGFLRQFDADLKNLGVAQAPFDLLAVHPYPSDPAANPADTEAAIYGPLRSELDNSWGDGTVPIFYDELGVRAISAAHRPLYGERSLSAASVNEGRQADYYRDAIKEAAQEDGVVGILLFQSEDVRNDGWPSGIYTPVGSRKSSWNTVAQAFHNARDGSF